MNHFSAKSQNPPAPDDADLLAEFRQLWAEAASIWDRHQEEPAFEGYVSSDYMAVYEALNELRGQVSTVLEWGSGLGVVAIMASRMGFEAYGIESEEKLVNYSIQLAQSYSAVAEFAHGNFIPAGFPWTPEHASHVVRTATDDYDGYGELDMELRDFDLVYAYPWPDERPLFHAIMRTLGQRGALLLTYDVREGIELIRFANE